VSLLLYYITDRSAFPGDDSARRVRLLEKITEAARAQIDFIQLREKDLRARELEALAREAVSILSKLKTENGELRTKLLINSRSDVALAAGADGVHLRSDDISPREIRNFWKESACGESVREEAVIGVSCHTSQEVKQAKDNGADFAVFAPVFEKKGARAAGLENLRNACEQRFTVLALGGITLDNVDACLDAGAAGIAAIRLFQENNISAIVRKLREKQPA
jgi:thiamine-phosphate pyrophosphorylase